MIFGVIFYPGLLYREKISLRLLPLHWLLFLIENSNQTSYSGGMSLLLNHYPSFRANTNCFFYDFKIYNNNNRLQLLYHNVNKVARKSDGLNFGTAAVDVMKDAKNYC